MIVPAIASTIPRRLPPRLPATAAPAKNSNTSPSTAKPASTPTVVQPIPGPGLLGNTHAKIAVQARISQLPGIDKRFDNHADILAKISSSPQT